MHSEEQEAPMSEYKTIQPVTLCKAGESSDGLLHSFAIHTDYSEGKGRPAINAVDLTFL